MIAGWLKRKIVNPVLDLLRQGIAPEKIALTIALGVTLGVTPVLGSTSLLCFLAAVLLRLNLPAIQLVNYCVYPLQFLLLMPFIRAGEWMFAAPPVRITLGEILGLIREDVWNAIATLWTSTMHALAAWLVLGSVASLVIYALLTPLLKRVRQSMRVVSQ
jgi:hypothetical protein